MNDLISPSQSAFLKGRNITDAYVATCKLIGWESKTVLERVGVKVDFEMAYNKIY